MKIIYTNENGGVNLVFAANKKDIEFTLKSMPLFFLEKEVLNNRLPQSVVDNLISDLASELSDDDWQAIVIMQSVPSYAKDFVILADDYVLPDREFRNAWKIEVNTIGHDLDKAKAIQLERVRFAREPKLAELDREYMIEDEKGVDGDKAAVTARKKLLRDITEPLKALIPTSIDDIKNAFPLSLRE